MKHTELAVHEAKHCYGVALEDQDVHYVKIILLPLSQDAPKGLHFIDFCSMYYFS